MALTRAEKEVRLQFLKDNLLKAQSVVMLDYCGIKVTDVDRVRRKCEAAGVMYCVVKNTLARLAIEDTPMKAISPHLTGTIALAFSKEDPIAAAKIISEVASEIEALKLKGVYLDGQVMLGVDSVKRLAAMPGKNELRAQFLGLLNTPARNLVSVLAAVPRSAVTVLKAYADKQGKAA